MARRFSIRSEIKVIAVLAGVFCLVAFVGQRHKKNACNEVAITLDNAEDNHFLGQADIFHILEMDQQALMGSPIDEIDLGMLESRLRRSPYISDAQVYRSLRGSLRIQVALRRPVARLLCTRRPDAYIAEDGALMPLSSSFTSRVLLISGPAADRLANENNIHRLDVGRALMEVLAYIRKDRFWQAQVAQLHINKEGEMLVYPQITGQRVEFGAMEDIAVKFDKLMIWYKTILPQRGWTKYSRVNVEYENQIVAE